MATFRMSQCQDGDEVLKCCEWRCEGTKDALENLNTRKGASRRTLKGILSKKSENPELEPSLRSKHLRDWSSRSIRSR